LKYFEYNFTAD